MRHLKFASIIALPISGILNFFQVYVFSDWEFVRWLVVLIVLDTLLSLLSHWISKDVSSEGFGMIAKKLIVYSAVMILSHVLANYSVDGSAITTLQWFRTFSCSFLMVREALSIVEKIEAVLPGFFPESIINHLKNFNNNNNNNKEVLR